MSTPTAAEARRALELIEDIWEFAPELPYTKVIRAYIDRTGREQPESAYPSRTEFTQDNGGPPVIGVALARQPESVHQGSSTEQTAQDAALDSTYPEGFDASCGLSAHAMQTANAILTSLIGRREWDVPMVAAALESFAGAFPHQSMPEAGQDVSALLRQARDALARALPICQSDAQMMADITRHAPLDAASQAQHDSTEYESERLVRDIPATVAAIDEHLKGRP